MKIILIGPPGAGKGTYATRLSENLRIPHVSTGDIVRKEIRSKNNVGKSIKKYNDRGELVPDDIIILLLRHRLDKPDSKNGFILDGYPRTLPQAKLLDEITNLDYVINLKVPDELIIFRLSNRILCNKCGAIYNIATLKPKKEMICDKCQGSLYRREDDNPEVVQNRLFIYRKQTAPLIEYYTRKGLLREIECNRPDIQPETIIKMIMNMLQDKKSILNSS